MILRYFKKYWPMLIAGFFVFGAFVDSCLMDIEEAYGFKLPGMVKNQNLLEYMDRVEESEIENTRDGSKGRRASLNKKPWLEGNDNLHAMESLVWPDFGGREVPDWRIYPPDDRPITPPGGSYCVFYQPNITDDCDEIYTVRMGILVGVVTELKVSGPVSGWAPSGQPFGMAIDIEPLANASYGSEIEVEAWTVSDAPGDDSTGYCKTILQLLCGDECECSGVTPAIYASSSSIAAGGNISMYVNSGGLACPPYTWAVAGTGFSLNKSTTDNDFETVILSCASGNCGPQYDAYCTVTVTDACGSSDSVKILYDGGQWAAKCELRTQNSGFFCDSIGGNTFYYQQGNELWYHNTAMEYRTTGNQATWAEFSVPCADHFPPLTPWEFVQLAVADPMRAGCYLSSVWSIQYMQWECP